MIAFENREIYTMYRSRVTVDGVEVETYGIRGKTVSFDDVSTDRAKVEEMVKRLNTEKLEECHFYYFISDELDK